MTAMNDEIRSLTDAAKWFAGLTRNGTVPTLMTLWRWRSRGFKAGGRTIHLATTTLANNTPAIRRSDAIAFMNSIAEARSKAIV